MPHFSQVMLNLWLTVYIGLLHSATKTRAKQGFHTVQYARIQRDRGPDPPPPPPPPKIIKLPSLHSMLEHHRSASETPFKWRFAFCGIWIHSTHQIKKTLSELVLQCQGQFERSKVPCAEFFCFPLSASRQ